MAVPAPGGWCYFRPAEAGTGIRARQISLICIADKADAEPQVVVRVRRIIPVAVRRPAVPGIVVPATPAVHAVRALLRIPKTTCVR